MRAGQRPPPRSSKGGGPAGGSGGPSATRFGPAYQGGLEAALAVVIAMGFGIWADSYFGTSPIGLFLGLGIGFGAFILRLVRLLGESNPPAEQPEAARSELEEDASDNGRGDLEQ